jgi:hypothetical protein
MSRLRAFRSLAFLFLGDTKITDAGLAEIALMPGLVNLALNGTAVTDVGIAKLTALKRLETLSLRKTNSSDKSLKELIKLDYLEHLDPGEAITDSGWDEYCAQRARKSKALRAKGDAGNWAAPIPGGLRRDFATAPEDDGRATPAPTGVK